MAAYFMDPPLDGCGEFMGAIFQPAYFYGAVEGRFHAAGQFVSGGGYFFAVWCEAGDEDEDVFGVFIHFRGAAVFAVPVVDGGFVSDGYHPFAVFLVDGEGCLPVAHVEGVDVYVEFEHAAPYHVHQGVRAGKDVGACQFVKACGFGLGEDFVVVFCFGFFFLFYAQFFFVFSEEGGNGGGAFHMKMSEGVVVAFDFSVRHGGVHFEEQVRFGAAAAPEGFGFQVHAPVVNGPDGQDAYAESGNGIK